MHILDLNEKQTGSNPWAGRQILGSNGHKKQNKKQDMQMQTDHTQTTILMMRLESCQQQIKNFIAQKNCPKLDATIKLLLPFLHHNYVVIQQSNWGLLEVSMLGQMNLDTTTM